MILESIKKILDSEKFECTLIPAKEAFPLDRLLVFLALDAKKRERSLEIFAIQQQLSPEYLLPKGAAIPFRLQFRSKLPFKVEDRALSQVGSLLLFVNQLIDLPSFELNELEGEVLYRYVWMMEESSITPTLVMSLFGSIMLNLGLFAGTIESLAEGKITFNELLAQLVKLNKSNK